MSEMLVTPSLSPTPIPTSGPPLRPAGSTDASIGNAAKPATPTTEKPQAATADAQAPGADAAAPGPEASPFAAIMQRHLAQTSATADAAPAKKLAAADIAPDPTAGLAALLPLIQSLAPNAAGQGGAAEAKTTAGQDSAPAIDLAAPLGKAAPAVDPAASLVKQGALPGVDLAGPQAKKAGAGEDPSLDPAAGPGAALPVTPSPGQTGLSGPSNSTAVPSLAAAPMKKTVAAENSAPDPAAGGLAPALPMIQSLLPNKAGQHDPAAVAENRQGTAPKAAQPVAGAAQIQAAEGGATMPTAAASDKAAITAALSASTGDVTAAHGKQDDVAAPEGTFQNLLAAAQVTNPSHPSDSRASTPLHVETPVGANGWNDNVGDKLVWMVGRQEQRAELVLNPPHLGRVEVSLSMNGDQASAQFVSANPAVRDALEAALPRLREMLADAGVSLGQAQVGSDSANNAANQSADRRENRDNQPGASAGLGAMRQISASAPWLRQGNGMVDVFA